MKPDLTFRRSMRMIMKRWWLLVICGVLVGDAAFVVVHMKKPAYQIATKITLKDFVLAPNSGTPGYVLVPVQVNFADQWVSSDFITSQAAITTSRNLGGSPSSAQIMSGLVMTGLTPTTVELQYTTGSSAAEAQSVLRQYTTVLISQRINALQTAMSQASDVLQTKIDDLNCDGKCAQAVKIARNQATLASLEATIPGDYSSTFDSAKAPPRVMTIAPSGPPAALAGVGGFLAGVVLGALLALLWGWSDELVRRPAGIV